MIRQWNRGMASKRKKQTNTQTHVASIRGNLKCCRLLIKMQKWLGPPKVIPLNRTQLGDQEVQNSCEKWYYISTIDIKWLKTYYAPSRSGGKNPFNSILNMDPCIKYLPIRDTATCSCYQYSIKCSHFKLAPIAIAISDFLLTEIYLFAKVSKIK